MTDRSDDRNLALNDTELRASVTVLLKIFKVSYHTQNPIADPTCFGT